MLNSLKIYTVHIHPDMSHAQERPIFVREGFNVWAFLLTVFWALYHRLWWVAGFVVLANIIVGMIGELQLLSTVSVVLLQLAIQVVVGLCGNDWLRTRLQQKGYILADITAGDSVLRAEQRYFERMLSAA